MFLWFVLLQCCLQVVGKCLINEKPIGFKEALCQNLGLTIVPDYLPVDIKGLYLSGNNLTKLQGRQFCRYAQLQQLFLDNNQLTVLDSNVFCCLSKLRILSMTNNYLHISKAYPIGIFDPLKKLRILDISRNMRKKSKDMITYEIPVHELKNLRKLSIDLVYEPVFGENFKTSYFQDIRFAVCNIENLRNSTFKNLPKIITRLYMRDCKDVFTIESASMGHFPQLNTIDFTNSKTNFTQALSALYPFQNKIMETILFRNINPVTEIVLTLEMMKYISTICIKTLDLSHNSIIYIQDKSIVSFKHPQCFKNLLLSANRFSLINLELEFFIFVKRMKNLKIFDYSFIALHYEKMSFLDLEDNGTVSKDRYVEKTGEVIPTGIFPSQVEFFRVSHMMGSTIVLNVICYNSSLKYLDMSYFAIGIFPSMHFVGYNSLEYLDLSGISWTLTLGKLPLLVNLRILIMKQTELYKIIRSNDSLFYWAPNIRKLDISYNFIWEFGTTSFGEVKHLTYLNLSHNLIEIVPHALTRFERLIELDLTYNLITSLPDFMQIFIDLQHKRFKHFHLYLFKNSLICSCDTQDFIKWMYKTKAIFDENKNYTCWLPAEKRTLTNTINVIENFHNYFVECDSKVLVEIGSSLLATTIVVLACAIILYNFRWRIIFFFYHKFRKFAEKELKVYFKFDVYVSYSDDSASFVKKVLQPKFEREWGLKMCFEDRDFPVGASAADSRGAFIHDSKHIVFLITPSFINNEWKHFEIERAKYEKFTKYLQKIVVITRNVALKDMPLEFGTLWKDLFLIEWPNDIEGVDMSWRKLRLWFF